MLRILQKLVDNESSLTRFLRSYVINNKAKNSASRDEAESKKNLLVEMIRSNVSFFEDTIEVGEEKFVYKAVIGDVEESIIDPDKLFKYLDKGHEEIHVFCYYFKRSR